LIPKGLVDRWRERPITEIDGDDIHLIVNEARERGVPGLERRATGPSESQARTMFATLSKLFGWLVEQRRSRSNPCAGVHRPATLKARDRVLTDAEQVAFWKATDAERNEFGALLKLLLITGCRLNEVAQMRRAELSGDRGTWTIPGKRTKNNRTHVVPLPSIARALIASVPTEGDLVFTTDGHHPVSGWSKIKNRLDAAMQIPPWRFHDLRRTCATGMAELGIAPHIVEAVLNHVSGARAGVAGTYNRAAYASGKKAALERWAAHVEGLIKGRPASVVTLHHRAEA
jgi:integrase